MRPVSSRALNHLFADDLEKNKPHSRYEQRLKRKEEKKKDNLKFQRVLFNKILNKSEVSGRQSPASLCVKATQKSRVSYAKLQLIFSTQKKKGYFSCINNSTRTFIATADFHNNFLKLKIISRQIIIVLGHTMY